MTIETRNPPVSATYPDWIALTRARAAEHGGQRLYRVLEGDSEEALSFAALDQRAQAIAAELQDRFPSGAAGERVLLLHPPGLGFITALFGCLYAGAVAVPTFPPRSAKHRRLMQRLAAVAADAQPALALTTADQLANIEGCIGELSLGIPTVASDTLADESAARWQPPVVDGNTLACLQYTSGSTGHPKGVMLSHGNLLANSALIQQAFGHGPDSIGVIWLPPYHDMGLIGGILQPLYVGFPVNLMAPNAFLKEPQRWLESVSRYRATTSGGPNFAYEWCLERIPAEARAALDLSAWRLAFNGAEPVQADTLTRFSEAFAPQGFPPNAHYPCYGLAEHSLIVTGGDHEAPAIATTFERAALNEGRAVVADPAAAGSKELVACGAPLAGVDLCICDPDTSALRVDGEVGEIWVRSPSVAQGYWGRQPSANDFAAHPVGEEEGAPYLRSGDLGFLHDGQLYVVGRRKDQLKIRGLGYDPADIETTAREAHPALATGLGAAFTVTADHQERAVLVHEVAREARRDDLGPILVEVREAVAEAHELPLHAVLLVPPGQIPRTPGGKLQRHAALMNVGVAYAARFKKVWLKLEVPDDSSIQEVIEHSGLLSQFPEIDLGKQKVGIFGKVSKLSTKVKDGDRVEIYRDITADPETVERRDIQNND